MGKVESSHPSYKISEFERKNSYNRGDFVAVQPDKPKSSGMKVYAGILVATVAVSGAILYAG